MCQKCVEAVKKHWPKLPESQYSSLLLGCTAWPCAGPEETERQLKDMAIRSGQDLGMAMAIADTETREAMSQLEGE